MHPSIDQYAIQLSKIKHKVRRLVSEHKKNDHQCAAFWDFDGTIINGDMTEGRHLGVGDYKGLFERVVKEGLVPEFSDRNGFQRYQENYRKKKSTQEAYIYLVSCLDQLNDDQQKKLSLFVHEWLSSHYKYYLYSFSVELINYFNSLGVLNYIISASPHCFVKELSSILPIPKEQLFGIDTNRISSGIDPIVHHAEGKAKRVEFIVEHFDSDKTLVPVFAAGNSCVADGPMVNHICNSNGVGLMINALGQTDVDMHHETCFVAL